MALRVLRRNDGDWRVSARQLEVLPFLSQYRRGYMVTALWVLFSPALLSVLRGTCGGGNDM